MASDNFNSRRDAYFSVRKSALSKSGDELPPLFVKTDSMIVILDSSAKSFISKLKE